MRLGNEFILNNEKRILKELEINFPESFIDCINVFDKIVKAHIMEFLLDS